MDPISTAALAAASKAAADGSSEGAKAASNLLTRLIGPSVDVIGANWADKLREKNMQRLLDKTEKRAKAREDAGQDPGFANPRVASQVFESAQYADGEVVAEYLSGVLASSRNPEGTNDAGVAWSTVVSRLSSDQLKLHYAIYASARPVVIAKGFAKANEAHNLELVLQLDALLLAAQLLPIEHMADAIDGLMREGLIGDGYRYGSTEHVFAQKSAGNPEIAARYPHSNGLQLSLSIHGMRLFVWGNGAGNAGIEAYIDPSIVLEATDPSLAPKLVPAYVVADILAAP